MDLGIGVVREGIRWPMRRSWHGNYDWASVKAVQEAATACKITPIWDLCHYGFPDGCDPFSDECLKPLRRLLPRRRRVRHRAARKGPTFSRRSTRSPFSPPRQPTWLDVSVREGPRRRIQASLVPDGDRGRSQSAKSSPMPGWSTSIRSSTPYRRPTGLTCRRSA